MRQFIVQIDAALTKAISGWPPALRTPFMLLSAISHPLVLSLAALCTAAMLWPTRASFALVAAVGATGVNVILKYCIRRSRPNTPYVGRMLIKSPSFPSGHAFASTMLLGTGTYLAAFHLPAAWTAALIFTATTMVMAVGASRVYLGAHYPTDVIAGWTLGACTLGVNIITLVTY